MTFGISTSFLSDRWESPDTLFSFLEKLPFVSFLELDYRIPESFIKPLKKLIPKHGYRVYSVHNFLPLPQEKGPTGSISEPLNLASLDEEERKLAVRYTMRSIDNLLDFEGEVLVVHLGKVPMDNHFNQLKELFEKDPQGLEELVVKLLEERRSFSKSLDRAMMSLEEILKRADKEGIKVGLENRYFINEIPFSWEFEEIFKEFEGAPLFYWHDVGHGEVLDRLGFQKSSWLLESFSKKAIGFHVHDVEGLSDHLPPGKGSVDFKRLIPFFSDHLVYEIHYRFSEEDILKGHEFLEEVTRDREKAL